MAVPLWFLSPTVPDSSWLWLTDTCVDVIDQLAANERDMVAWLDPGQAMPRAPVFGSTSGSSAPGSRQPWR